VHAKREQPPNRQPRGALDLGLSARRGSSVAGRLAERAGTSCQADHRKLGRTRLQTIKDPTKIRVPGSTGRRRKRRKMKRFSTLHDSGARTSHAQNPGTGGVATRESGEKLRPGPAGVELAKDGQATKSQPTNERTPLGPRESTAGARTRPARKETRKKPVDDRG